MIFFYFLKIIESKFLLNSSKQFVSIDLPKINKLYTK